MLWAAKNPIVILGGTRWSPNACAAVARFAERFKIPVATSFRRAMLFDALHECFAGDFGIGPNPALLKYVKAATSSSWSAAGWARCPRKVTRCGIFRIRKRRSCMCIRASRNSAASTGRPGDQCVADRVRGRARRRAAAAEGDCLGRRDKAVARELPRLERAGDRRAGTGQHGRSDPALAQDAPRRLDHLQRRRQFRDLGASLLPLPQICDSTRADLRLDGLRTSGRGRRQARVPGARGGLRSRATATS